jgi:hypothetical protein
MTQYVPSAPPFPLVPFSRFLARRRWLKRIYQNVNLLNMYCNILHTLDPTPGNLNEYADQLFEAVLTYAQSVQSTSTVTFNDPTGEDGRQWLYDAMNQLIIMTLNNDPSLDPTVRNDLMNDLTGLQLAYGIDANEKATVQARLMLAQTNIFIANMAKWMTAIGTAVGTAIGKLWGTSSFSQARNCVSRAADKVAGMSEGSIALIKGVAILTMVSGPVTRHRSRLSTRYFLGALRTLAYRN